ncbi:MAG: glycosidase [Fimbriimonas ginsengisoli]|uniref:Glycosidase n=1 Tax=Fimbriimonas ginsengisoli TaxID=1005039 RepID=A0A931LS53_FIMGI|nr:glycosidase [Fimbriimonas ginsengisoli]
MHEHFTALFKRCRGNPILTAEQWPYPVHAVLNPGAALLPDGTTLLLCRVEDRRGISHLTVARSPNGIDAWTIDSAPTFAPDPDHYPEEIWGIEDPRITYMPELEQYAIAYTAYTKSGPGVALALTPDFVDFKRVGLVMQPSDKDAALLPHKVGGRFALIHRPSTGTTSDMWISYSPDLQNWGGHQLLLPARRGAWWDANKIGLSCPPIETDRGWLVLYHGVRTTASGSLYRLGLALLDLENPEKGLSRGGPWMFGPEHPYELMGDVPNVVFPCGYTLASDGDTIHLYYGAADTCIALATGSVRGLLEWLDENGTEYIGVAGQPAERVHA